MDGNEPNQAAIKYKKKTPYNQAEDPKLRDLINKLLVEDPDKRLSWEEYFNHPFFAKDETVPASTYWSTPDCSGNQVASKTVTAEGGEDY